MATCDRGPRYFGVQNPQKKRLERVLYTSTSASLHREYFTFYIISNTCKFFLLIKELACIKQVADWILSKVNEFGTADDKALVNGLFGSDSDAIPGFLIKERVLNLPAGLMLIELRSLK